MRWRFHCRGIRLQGLQASSFLLRCIFTSSTSKILQRLHQDPQNAVFSTATDYEWTVCGLNAGKGNTFSLLQNHQTGTATNPPPINGYRPLLPEQSDWCVKLTTHFHLVPRFWMSGTTPLLPLYVFKTCIGSLPCKFCTVLHNVYRILRRQYETSCQ